MNDQSEKNSSLEAKYKDIQLKFAAPALLLIAFSSIVGIVLISISSDGNVSFGYSFSILILFAISISSIAAYHSLIHSKMLTKQSEINNKLLVKHSKINNEILAKHSEKSIEKENNLIKQLNEKVSVLKSNKTPR